MIVGLPVEAGVMLPQRDQGQFDDGPDMGLSGCLTLAS